MTYGDSMNLRNILWLAPDPGDSDDSWVAPGIFTETIISVLSLNAFSHGTYSQVSHYIFMIINV